MSAQEPQSPVVLQPIPRRPFATYPASPPDDDPDTPSAPGAVEAKLLSGLRQRPAPLSLRLPQDSPRRSDSAQFLDPGALSRASSSPSRAQSVRNLTSSTLFGIFGASDTPGPETPALSVFGGDDSKGPGRLDNEDDDDAAEAISAADVAKIRKASMSLLMLQRQNQADLDSLDTTDWAPPALSPTSPSRPLAIESASDAPSQSLSRALTLFSAVGRAVLLFSLGMGYGVLVSRLHRETQVVFDDIALSTVHDDWPPADDQAYDATADWRYLASWGVAGVVLGTLLPWFDGLWDRTLGIARAETDKDREAGAGRAAPETDWALVVRGIGAFAGVVFAMRKLPWASTLQASMTLALANPFLWYLLDRSKSGLLLAVTVGFVGSVVLTALNVDLVPIPASQHDGAYAAHNWSGMPELDFASRAQAAQAASARDLLSVATAEMAVWMISVLFCSCVCFGNIGRRLALRPQDTAQGLWA